MVHATHAAGFEGPLSIIDDAAIAELRVVLNKHGFTGTGITDAIGAPLAIASSHLRDDLPLYLHRLKVQSPINTLAKLFALDQIVTESEAIAAFAPLQLSRLYRMGLLREVSGGVRARLRLSCYDGLIIAHDAYDEEKKTLRPDHVLDVNPTTISLSNLTIRRPVKRALEIGTGCGALALKASRHARKVIGTDTNPRALNFATFNAAINGITNVEWRLGSLFEPVKGEKFDLLFCNPPYVISPDTKLIFRDGGRRGDSLCEEIIRGTPDYLEEGGYASFLINWGIHKDEEWSAPIRRWTEGNRCDTWIMLSGSQDPTTYSAVWNRTRDRAVYAENLERWITYFDELKLLGIGLGVVVLRRCTTRPTWVRADQLPDTISQPSGVYIERLFESQDLLTNWSGDEPVLAARYHAAPRTQLRQLLTVKDARFEIDAAEILLADGLPFHGHVDVFASQLLARCDGTRPLRDVASEIAGQAGADEATFTATAAGIARRLIAMGFLVPVLETPAVAPHTDRHEGSVR